MIVSAARKKTVDKGGRRPGLGPATFLPVLKSEPLSLPPAVPEPDQSSPPPATKGPPDDKKPSWWSPDDSKVRIIAMQIIAMRISGMSDDEIAPLLNISRKSIAPYVYRAGKNGWLTLDQPKDRIEFELLHKVVRNLEEGLDAKPEALLNTGMPLRTAVALKVAEGTVFKQFSEPATQQIAQTAVAIRIEMPAGAGQQQIREDTTGGVPAYIDVEQS